MKNKGQWVLIVEDDAELAKGLQVALKDAGLSAQTVETAQEAIDKIHNQDFACIVLDMALKRGTGEDVVHFLNGQSGRARPHVIVTSGSLNVPLVQRLVSVTHEILVKPYEVSRLVERIREKVQSAGSKVR